jgi:MFS family permease
MRILQGIGGAMMVPVGRLVVLRTTPEDRLIKAIATLTWPALVAPIMGRRLVDLLPPTPAGTGSSFSTSPGADRHCTIIADDAKPIG